MSQSEVTREQETNIVPYVSKGPCLTLRQPQTQNFISAAGNSMKTLSLHFFLNLTLNFHPPYSSQLQHHLSLSSTLSAPSDNSILR